MDSYITFESYQNTGMGERRRISSDTQWAHFDTGSEGMTDRFPARVSRSGSSKVVTIPEAIRDSYQVGDVVQVTLEKKKNSC